MNLGIRLVIRLEGKTHLLVDSFGWSLYVAVLNQTVLLFNDLISFTKAFPFSTVFCSCRYVCSICVCMWRPEAVGRMRPLLSTLSFETRALKLTDWLTSLWRSTHIYPFNLSLYTHTVTETFEMCVIMPGLCSWGWGIGTQVLPTV